MQGKTKGIRFNLIDVYDPRIAGCAAQKGTLFLYTPDVGDPELLIKQDDGLSTNWVNVGGSAFPITVVVAASVADVTVASAPADIDGVTLADGDLVLLKDQTLPEENGVYQFSAAGDPLSRSSGWNTAAEFIPGKQVFADGGTVNADTTWVNADYVAVLGTDPVVFLPVSAEVVGLPNTLALFNSLGKISSDAQASFFQTNMAMFFGIIAGSGVFTSNGSGAMAHGRARGDVNGAIDSTGAGSQASGFADDVGGTGTTQIVASGSGSVARGRANTDGVISASGDGSHACGESNNLGCLVEATSSGAFACGSASSSGVITAGGVGSMARGSVTGATSKIESSDVGAIAQGYAEAAGQITAEYRGAIAMGSAAGGGRIRAMGAGSIAAGGTSAACIISARGDGSMAFGIGTGDIDTDAIRSDGYGSLAFGSSGGATIYALGDGSFAGGVTDNTAGSGIDSQGSGSFAIGRAVTAGVVQALNTGSMAFGHAETSGSIISDGYGNLARGYAQNSGILRATGASGATAAGDAFGVGSIIEATERGSFAGGHVENGAVITASNYGAFVFGWADGANTGLVGSALGSVTFGQGNQNSSFMCLVIGRYAPSTAYDPIAWQTSEPVFVVGNGSSNASRASAYEIRKDGYITHDGGYCEKANRTITTDAQTIDANDFITFIDQDSFGGVGATVLLPVGVEGMTFWIKAFGDPNNNVTITAQGGNTIEAAGLEILATQGASRLMYFSGGVWYFLTFM